MTKRKKAVIKWLIYWGIILAAYFTLSIIFDNFMLYLPVPALAALNFLIRIAVDFPLSKLKNEAAKKALSVLAAFLSVAAIAGIGLNIIQNGSSYNEAYIESLDYSGFEHRSSFSYDSESGVYTVRAEGDELKILQLTDIHLCGSITTIGTDRKAIDACY